MFTILNWIKERMNEHAKADGVYIDFTMGNGHDTLFLAKLAPHGHVYSFDIQPEALKSTKSLLDSEQVTNVTLICDSHEKFAEYCTEPVDGAMFNLGYLPGGDKSITTRRDTTLKAVTELLPRLKNGAVVGIAIYPGHEEGEAEGEALLEMLSTIPKKQYDCYTLRMVNVPTCPYVCIINKK